MTLVAESLSHLRRESVNPASHAEVCFEMAWRTQGDQVHPIVMVPVVVDVVNVERRSRSLVNATHLAGIPIALSDLDTQPFAELRRIDSACSQMSRPVLRNASRAVDAPASPPNQALRFRDRRSTPRTRNGDRPVMAVVLALLGTGRRRPGSRAFLVTKVMGEPAPKFPLSANDGAAAVVTRQSDALIGLHPGMVIVDESTLATTSIHRYQKLAASTVTRDHSWLIHEQIIPYCKTRCGAQWIEGAA